jgi:hypothetical protein
MPSNYLKQNSRVQGVFMERILTIFVLGGLALAQASSAQVNPLAAKSAVPAASGAANSPDVPSLPKGKSTIFGGQIRNVDQVRDQIVLSVYGEKPMKILYDERTQVFRDGKRIPLHDLAPTDHVSVQTTLDGAKIFAISIHILSNSPQGSFQGRVLDYDPQSGMLTLTGSNTGNSFRVEVTKETTVTREGQQSFTAKNRGQFDLVRGALLAVTFQAGGKGQGIAKDITVLATPGASFVFSGNITALNLSDGWFVVTDPRDDKTYQIHFDTHDPNAIKLKAGDHVRISADYDGTRYVATDLAAQ